MSLLLVKLIVPQAAIWAAVWLYKRQLLRHLRAGLLLSPRKLQALMLGSYFGLVCVAFSEFMGFPALWFQTGVISAVLLAAASFIGLAIWLDKKEALAWDQADTARGHLSKRDFRFEDEEHRKRVQASFCIVAKCVSKMAGVAAGSGTLIGLAASSALWISVARFSDPGHPPKGIFWVVLLSLVIGGVNGIGLVALGSLRWTISGFFKIQEWEASDDLNALPWR